MAVAGLLAGLTACGGDKEKEEKVDYEDQVEELVASEEWIELMGGHLNKQVKILSVLSGTKGPWVAELSGPPGSGREAAGIRWIDFRYGEGGERFPGFAGGDLVEVMQAKYGFRSGEFVGGERTRFRARVEFSAKGKLESGEASWFQSEQVIEWILKDGGTLPEPANDYLIEPGEWEVADWRMTKARLTMSERPLFREVTTEVLQAEDLAKIESTGHAAHLKQLFSGGEIMLPARYGRFFTTDATAQHPGLSVVDIDNDGRDDLYVCVRWGRNLLFRDRGDGTFEEVAEEYGLDLEGLSACSIFADFDNDGDQDVVIGRSLERSLYLRNEGGRFVDVSESHVDVELPYLTTSLAAADYNGDGLLDLYLSTYGFAIRQPRDQVAKAFLQNEDPKEVTERFVSPGKVEPYLNLPGPPNVLLVNTGEGRFERSPLSGQVAVWHETLQSTWADYDGDGDQDLYVCNDFAPDRLFRNDGGKAFVDVTSSEGHARMRGFGMGASFGDFDNDLDLDLYVSNMFSKAGLRIIDRVGMEDERFRWSAEGNLLFANEEGRFRFLSGVGSPHAVVARADWSWGGQFCDFDNDGFLDLYVPNGYFTAPEGFAGDEDL